MNALTTTYAPAGRQDEDVAPSGALERHEFERYVEEMEQQPPWRYAADREMEYYDGNQLSAEILDRQKELGMPPAIEPLIGPAIDAVLGLEAKNRADWRVEASSENTGEEVAKAYGFKLNQAERKSKADRACSEAYKFQVAIGMGWVEVSRETNPFKYPYRCLSVNRNEIFWDMLAVEPDLSDARWLMRKRWVPTAQIALTYKKHRDLIEQCRNGWQSWGQLPGLGDGGTSTDLSTAYDRQRGSSIEEAAWRESGGARMLLIEVWYRRWVSITVIRTKDGRIVEVDPKNPVHMAAIAAGVVTPEKHVVPKMRMSMWLGPHRLEDKPTPYRHEKFPYVAFWGKKEDRTGVPYGLVRGMIFMQDNVNATTSKLRWGLAAVRVVRTQGAVAMKDAHFREEIARPDADIILDEKAMADPGARFEVDRDFQLNTQQFQLLQDSRAGINRVSGIDPSMQGSTGATSGVHASQQVEQGTQALGDINDNFNYARAEVGELLLSLIVQDDIGKPQQVLVSGQSIRDDTVVLLNQPMQDEDTGMQYLDNDVERAMLKVAINDVPSTSSYRAQQLSAMSEAFKSMPQEFQRVTMPYLVALMDLPSDSRAEIIKAVREAAKMPTAKEIEQQIAEAVKQARTADARDLKIQELAAKYNPEMLQAQIAKLVAEAFKTNTEAFYATNQTAGAIAANPALAPVADSIAQLSGWRMPTPAGQDPNIQVPAEPAVDAMAAAQAQGGAVAPVGGGPANTSPMLPPVPQSPGSPNVGAGAGSETQRMTDNAPEMA